jgi:hypothetical protein
MTLLILHAAATWFMTGVIWVVQLVHYPLMGEVGQAQAAAYAARHQRRIAVVVVPVMLAEAVTALLLVALPPAGRSRLLPGAGLALLFFIWASTALLQMPAHARLLAGPDPAGHRRLVRGNWVRTLLWSARALLAAALLYPAG